MASAGQLNHRLLLQKAVVSRTASGAAVMSWVTLRSIWASVTPLNGQEALVVNQHVTSFVNYAVTVRWSTAEGFSPKGRLLWGDKTLGIEAVFDRDGDRRFLTLLCEEVANG